MTTILKGALGFLIFFSYTNQALAEASACNLVLSSAESSSSMFSKSLNDEEGATLNSTTASLSAAHESIEVFEIAEDHKVAYRYTPPKEGKPTLVLLNGLIYSLDYWNDYYNGLVDQGYGVLLVAYSTQPESLSFLDDGVEPHFGSIGINVSEPMASSLNYTLNRLSSQDLVDEVMALVDHLEIPRFDLVSLSYSSFVAIDIARQEKDRINTFVMQAPAVMPSNRYNPYGEAKHKYYEWLMLNPFSNADYLADYELYLTMYGALFQQYVNLPNSLIDFDKFFNGVYQMVRSVKWRDLKDYTDADLPPTHLFLASGEESALFDDQLKFWELMTGNESKGSLVLFLKAMHALPASATEASIDMTVKAVEGELSDDYVEVVSE